MTTFNDRLSPEKARELFDYCPVTGDIWWKRRADVPAAWNTRYAGKRAGTEKKGYVQICIKISGRKLFFSGQRLIWVLFYGVWPDGEVDHEDHNTLNNSIFNLRDASHSENGCNKFEVKGKVSFKGVYFMPAKGKFAAQIKRRGHWKWLGLHATAEDAAKAYDREAFALHGPFAKTNVQMGLLAI
ncbi:HNH endonuclease [Mesorhizobium sp. B2-1-2]|uniref:HNH endonuclease n=1 Tax=Mesorhizobium sp. B2-1-2 TaxID=2589973 RepID=UPI00112D4358|nr:HNH endonuclease [Mesorhizobium sp. B2-1-2]TPN04474.1 hypothetical protein FJ971_29455 [Mesorhizobium sp. B2-1-2]